MAQIQKTEEEWRKKLSPKEFEVLRKGGTEPAFSGAYWDNHEKGVYRCKACGAPLFSSNTKFDSGTGWPSFYDLLHNDAVLLKNDDSLGMSRKEVICANCGSHLGHVFDDGPAPTNKRYCINSCSLDFKKEDDGK